MREAVKDPHRLRHMVEAILNVNEFLQGKSEDDLRTDKILFFAVVKNIEIIGEAAYKLTTEFKTSHPQTPWRIITDMRHVLVHGYYQLSHKMVYHVYLNDLPILLSQLKEYLQDD